MNRPIAALALVSLAFVAGACRSSPSDARFEEWRHGAYIKQTPKAWHVIVSAHRGRIGYLKVFDVTEGGGAPYEWKYVYDADWRELGFVDQFGGATMYHYYSPAEQAQQNDVLRATKLPADSIQRNVLTMFGIDPSTDDVTFPVATRADITGDTGKQHLAGPGVVPAKAPEAAPAK